MNDRHDVRPDPRPDRSDPENAQRDVGHGAGPRAGGHVAPLWLTRRKLVQSSGLLAVSAGVAGAATSCGPWGGDDGDAISNANLADRAPVTFDQSAGVENTPTQVPDATTLRVLTLHEARTVEALTARILPGSPQDPGAREAGVVTYIDNFLAFNDGLAESTYRVGPWAAIEPASGQPGGGTPAAATPASGTPPVSATPVSVTPMSTPQLLMGGPVIPGATPVMAGTPGATPNTAGTPGAATAVAAGPTDADAIRIPADQIKRYGYQSRLTPLEVYRTGIAAVDQYAASSFGSDFVTLSEAQQDQLIDALAKGQATGFPAEVSGSTFFQNLRRHTSEGMFSDPVYGGNRDMVGWKLVGYPGVQRAYQPYEFQREGTDRQPQGILELSVFHAGHPTDDDNAIYPVSGTDEQHDTRRPTGN